MEYKVKGLDCASCAAKIEDELNKQYPESNAQVNFASCKITTNDNTVSEKQILEISSKIEEGMSIVSPIKTYKYKVEGLDCPECASKIEDSLNKLPNVENASLNFATSILQITYDEKDIDKIKEVIDKQEEGATLLALADSKGNEEDKLDITPLISIGVSIILVLIALFMPVSENIKTGIYVIAYIVAGYDILIKLVKNLLNRQYLDENFLMGIATIAAFAIGEHIEAISIMVFYKVGEFFQDLAVNRSRKNITSLMDIRPDYANLEHNGKIEKVNPESVNINDIIVVKPGEKIPLDGIIIEGNSFLDTKALTGESKDYEVGIDSNVLSGSVNKSGLLKIKVTKQFSDSTVSKILDLVENASANKAQTENFITKFARVYTPTVVALAAVVAFIVPLILQQDFNPWIYKALVFLVISCPCALVISIPLGFFGGIGNASKHGILIKGANYLEALYDVDTIAFDKTGTITKGVFEVNSINEMNNYSKEEVLYYTANAQAFSSHPLAASIKKYYQKDIDTTIISDYQDIAGQGVKALVNGKEVLAGNAKLLYNNSITFKEADVASTIVYVAINKIYAGYILIGDTVKENSASALKQMKQNGIKELVMLSGDNEKIAQEVASSVGIDKVYAQLLPNQKVSKIEELLHNEQGNGKVAYVGDGINDAPVIARADLGIAMGGVGSDAAIEAADIVIMNDDLSKIVTAKKIALKTRKIVKQNITLAIVVKLACLVLGVLGMAAIWEAVIADVGVALVAILNAMRVMNDKQID
ncbi:heavy metal translocating P-type ATPase [Mycoplasma sp. P36-A1]|uniref:heavy metal translocating P-type ATPase n=1 Tax=Mycoplasma sp. P36-A1 TaxID=3252900 RepID=UPI003C2DAE10